jgi:hypothetical protein
MVLISIDTKQEPEIMRALAKRHEIIKLYTVSGRYDRKRSISTVLTISVI